ncbi:MAG: carboxymuconolactone decarboxylase family protein [Alphaproteobacteria bacterium]
MAALPASGAGAFVKAYPAVWDRFTALGKACSEAGPLDARMRRLIKLALAIGALSEGAVHSHARQGLEEKLSVEELRQVAVLAIPTLGFPTAMAALSWINDIVEK